MALQKIITFGKTLEDSKNPLLGPNIKGLYWTGLWQTSTTIWTYCYNIFHYSSCLFILSLFLELYNLRSNSNKLLSNLSVACLSVVCVIKCISFLHCQKKWMKLVRIISEEEILEISKQNKRNLKLMMNYTKYSRLITYSYWILVFLTYLALIISPFIKYFTSVNYRDDIRSGKESYPEIVSCWVIFDKKNISVYSVAILYQAIMAFKGSMIVGAYDINAVTIMIFIKGQMEILKMKCKDIFKDDISSKQVIERIIECHRHHNFLIRCYKLFDALLSPIMFAYVLICSITICFSMVQFISDDATTSHKLWVIEYTSALIFQLFIYCWHSNEVIVESNMLDQSVYESNWWKADHRLRRQILILAGKLSQSFVLNAGPFSTLSVPTFVDIMKGAYSFFTLFSNFQD